MVRPDTLPNPVPGESGYSKVSISDHGAPRTASAVQNRLRVLVADDNRDLCALLDRAINTQPDMECVGSAYNGAEAVRLIRDTRPDVVILDLVLPLLDGIAVLESVREQERERSPHVILFTAFGREDSARRAAELGADYFIVKPFDLDTLTARIRQFAREKPPAPSSEPAPTAPAEDLERQVTLIMQEIGIPAHIRGYAYLRQAIMVMAEKRGKISTISRDVYPAVAERYGTTPSRVERAIRHAITLAWERGNPQQVNWIFGRDATAIRPSNAEFMATVVDKLAVSRAARTAHA